MTRSNARPARLRLRLCAALLVLASSAGARTAPAPAVVPAPATDAAPVAAPAPADAAPALPRLPAQTRIELEVVDGVSSATSVRGATFALRVREPVVVDGVVVVPAGTLGHGQVVHAQRKGLGGKPGELIVAARQLDLPGGPLKLRSSFGAAGQARTGAAVATTIAVGVFGVFVTGKDTVLPAGTALSARTAEDYPAAPAPLSAVGPAAGLPAATP